MSTDGLADKAEKISQKLEQKTKIWNIKKIKNEKQFKEPNIWRKGALEIENNEINNKILQENLSAFPECKDPDAARRSERRRPMTVTTLLLNTEWRKRPWTCPEGQMVTRTGERGKWYPTSYQQHQEQGDVGSINVLKMIGNLFPGILYPAIPGLKNVICSLGEE